MDKDNNLTKEQKLELKKKKFTQNPDKFICMDDLAISIQKLEDGRLAFLTNLKFSRIDFLIAKAEVDFQLTKVLHIIDEKIAERKSIILAQTRIDPNNLKAH